MAIERHDGDGRAAGETTRRLPHLWLGVWVAAALFVADQATKIAVLYGLRIGERGPVEVLPVLDIVLVWNPGISYGLLPQDGALGRGLLIAFTVVASGAIAVWMARARHRFTTVALALILGGALGNLVDRVVYGAVVDFVHFHVGSFSWYVFNLADAAIVLGVVGLLVDGLFRRERVT